MVFRKDGRSGSVQIECCLVLVITHILSPSTCIVHPDGESQVSRYQDELGNFQFGYTVADNEGEHFHKAGTDALGRVVGSYGMTLADGRRRFVDYVADKDGFRAQVRSNEQGISNAKFNDAIVENPEITADLPEPQSLELAASNTRASDELSERLKYTESHVVYVRPNENEEHKRLMSEEAEDVNEPLSTSDVRREPLHSDGELAIEGSRSVNQDTTGHLSILDSQIDDQSSVRLPVLKPEPAPQFGRRISTANQYDPPIDPNTYLRLPDYRRSSLPSSSHYKPRDTSSPEPSTPPYGGFDFESPLASRDRRFGRYPSDRSYFSTSSHSLFNEKQDEKYPFTIPSSFFNDKGRDFPTITMSTIHGGYTGRNPHTSSYPYDSYGARDNQYPNRSVFASENFPPNVGHQNNDKNYPPSSPQKPGLVLRAVAIPNGIQAVPVDPATGQVHDDREFRGYDPSYDTNIKDHPPKELNREKFFDFPPYRNPLAPPLSSHSPSHPREPSRNSNRSYHNHPGIRRPEEASLSKPSSKDLAHIARVFEHVQNQVRHSGSPPDPYHFDGRPLQHDLPPDYPPIDSRYPKTHDRDAGYEYGFDDNPKYLYNSEPERFPDKHPPVRRPSIAVRLPVRSDETPLRYGDRRRYRSALSERDSNEDDIVVGDRDVSEQTSR